MNLWQLKRCKKRNNINEHKLYSMVIKDHTLTRNKKKYKSKKLHPIHDSYSLYFIIMMVNVIDQCFCSQKMYDFLYHWSIRFNCVNLEGHFLTQLFACCMLFLRFVMLCVIRILYAANTLYTPKWNGTTKMFCDNCC